RRRLLLSRDTVELHLALPPRAVPARRLARPPLGARPGQPWAARAHGRVRPPQPGPAARPRPRRAGAVPAPGEPPFPRLLGGDAAERPAEEQGPHPGPVSGRVAAPRPGPRPAPDDARQGPDDAALAGGGGAPRQRPRQAGAVRPDRRPPATPPLPDGRRTRPDPLPRLRPHRRCPAGRDPGCGAGRPHPRRHAGPDLAARAELDRLKGASPWESIRGLRPVSIPGDLPQCLGSVFANHFVLILQGRRERRDGSFGLRTKPAK